MQCGFTVKMLEYLKGTGESVSFVDVNTSTGNAEFKRVTKGKNIRGVPYTIDNKTNKGIRGFQEIIL
jgi:glutaredoxin